MEFTEGEQSSKAPMTRILDGRPLGYLPQHFFICLRIAFSLLSHKLVFAFNPIKLTSQETARYSRVTGATSFPCIDRHRFEMGHIRRCGFERLIETVPCSYGLQDGSSSKDTRQLVHRRFLTTLHACIWEIDRAMRRCKEALIGSQIGGLIIRMQGVRSSACLLRLCLQVQIVPSKTNTVLIANPLCPPHKPFRPTNRLSLF